MTTNRRNFLKRSGLAIGAAALVSKSSLAGSKPNFVAENLSNEEQIQLLKHFDQWVSDYIDVIQEEKKKNREFKNNSMLTQLPDELEKWMPKLKQHFSDKQFAAEYLKVSERLSRHIDSQF
jgi:hypothetical protein